MSTNPSRDRSNPPPEGAPRSAYFFSDVHLGLGTREDERRKEDDLLAFLDSIAPTASEVFIVGDLFDLWFEYRTVIPRGFHRTLAALQRLTDGGARVAYLVGNHDFWMGDFFTTELGIAVHRDPVETRVQGKRVFLHHGDGLATNDAGYRFIKPILRSPVSTALYRWLHPDIGIRIARGSSRSSREYTSGKEYGEGEGMLRYATRKIAEGCDIVVMGHRHEPERQDIGGGTYVNLGDWITHRTYAVMTGGTITLTSWDRDRKDSHG